MIGKVQMEMPVQQFIFEKVFPYLRSESYENKINNILGLDEPAEKLKGHKPIVFKEELDSYFEDDFGFIRRNDEYYVCLDVPAFAVKSACDNNYYFFEKTQVAVNVYEDFEGRFKYWSQLFATKNNNNPIFHGETKNFITFCKGENKLPSHGKDLGDVIAQTLRKGKYIFLYSYLKPNRKCDELREKCEQCGNGHFGRNIRPIDELQKMGVQILQGGSRQNYC